MNHEEKRILETLDACIQSESVRAYIHSRVERVQSQLAETPSASMSWEPIPLSIYGETLPALVRSSWIFILRSGATTGAERHPNSHQRMVSFRGRGDAQTGGDGNWQSNPLISNREAAIRERWVSIPINVWHQMAVPGGEDWAVVSFHTVPAEELIEERPDGSDAEGTRQRLYIEPGKWSCS